MTRIGVSRNSATDPLHLLGACTVRYVSAILKCKALSSIPRGPIGIIKNDVSGVKRPARATYQAQKAVMMPRAPPAIPTFATPVNACCRINLMVSFFCSVKTEGGTRTAARRMKVMVRKKKTETKPTEDLKAAMRKIKVTTNQAVR